MSFIDTDDPFSIAAKRIRSSVIRSTPEPQLPIQGKQQPTTYIIEPDLMESQTGKMNLPNDVAFDDAGFAYNTVTGNPVQVIRRPNVLPIAKTPDGFIFAMPKILDAASNIVGGVAAPAVATKAGEVVLGSGAVRKSLDESLITKAKEHFGITREPKEAGYVLPDGSMLDLSGRHYATGYENINGRFVPKAGQPDYLKGTRSVDHREVADITDVGGTEGMRQFMNKTGAIRNQPGNGIDTTVIPTDQQLNRLISSHNSSYRGEPFTVDISNPITGENIASKTFEKPNVEKIKKWIADETAKYPTLYSDTRNQVYGQIGHQIEKQNQPFFSALERTVDNAKIGKADANQWLGYLKNQPGVKQEELSWVLNNLPEGQISKDQLGKIVRDNGVKLGEKVLGDIGEQWQLSYKDGSGTFQRFNTKKEAEDAIKSIGAEDRLEVKPFKDKTPTKYHDYQLPGGERYQEMLLTLPEKGISREEALAEAKRFSNRLGEDWNKIPADSQERYIEAARQQLEGNGGSPANYKSSHWDEPNILAHVRYNDRNIPDVGKSLHLEEIQSDWHQAGRKQGYKGESNLDKFNELDKQLQEAKADLGQAAIDSSQNSIGMSWAKFLQSKPTQEAKDAALAKIAEYRKTDARYLDKEAKVKELEEARARANPVGKVPDAPFKKNWDELAFKRMLHKAANEGYDSISWTPGEAQAARYDLSKQVEAIRANKNPDGTYMIGTQMPGRNMARPTKEMEKIPPEKLADYVGKDLAEKIIKGEGGKADEYGRVYSGLDLKIGGEGMKSFYDKMLVDKANALAKKYGAKVESGEIINPEEYKAWLELNEGQKTEVGDRSKAFHKIHYLPITKELREKAKAGFPLFSSIPITVPVSHNPFTEENKKYRLVPVPYNPFN